MANVGGLKDLRGHGPPADIGTFQSAASVIVFKHTFSGTDYIVAMRVGARGWTLVTPPNTDAATVIQAAIDELHTDVGGTIRIKRGKYRISKKIILYQYIRIFGAGIYVTRLNLMADVNDHLFEFSGADGPSWITLSDMMLYGRSGDNTSGSGIHLYKDTFGCADILFENLFVNDFEDHGFFIEQAWSIRIINCISESHNGDGCRIEEADGTDIEQVHLIVCHFTNNGGNGLSVEANTVHVFGGDYGSNGDIGIDFNLGQYNSIIGVYTYSNTNYGIKLTSTNNLVISNCRFVAEDVALRLQNCHEISVVNPSIRQCSSEGILVASGNMITIIGGVSYDCSIGLYCSGPDRLVVTGFNSEENSIHGFRIYNSTMMTISNCISYNNGKDGASIESSTDINLKNCELLSNSEYGIDIKAGNTRIIAKDNLYSGNTSGPINDAGTDTILEVKSWRFTEAVTGAISTTSPIGVDVDAVGEEAQTWGQLPLEVQQVVRIKIWAVSTGTPIGAGGQMHLEITFNAGGSLEAYNLAANSWNITDHDSEEADYTADDVIHWIIENGDVGDELSNLLGGDSFELKAIGEDGTDPDGATDGVFRVAEVEYV